MGRSDGPQSEWRRRDSGGVLCPRVISRLGRWSPRRVGHVGDAGFEAAYGEGFELDKDAAVAYAVRARGERKRPTIGWNSLTPTELQVIDQVATGRSNPEIAEALLMGRTTVKTHLTHIFTKLGITSRAELAAEATRRASSTLA